MKGIVAFLAALAGLDATPSSPRLLILPRAHLASAPSCATHHGHLSQLDYHLFRLPVGCNIPPSFTATAGRVIQFSERGASPDSSSAADGFLVHAIPSALDSSVPELALRRTELSLPHDSAQHPLHGRPEGPIVVAELGDSHRLLYFSTSSSLAAFTSLPENAFVELVGIPSHRLPFPTSSSSLTAYPPPLPVPAGDVARITHHLSKLKFNPLVHTLLTTLPHKKFHSDVRYLTGENQSLASSSDETWVSRHSMSEGGHKASNWIYAQLSAMGLNCTQHPFLNGFAPMIACEFPGSGTDGTGEIVVLGAHFDSRGSFGYPTAPGGDDDGSGTSLLLSLASHLTAHNLTFKRRLIIAAFAGEEQGLLGSQWFAKHLKDKGEDVALMIQVDMIGYRKPGEPMQLAFPPDTLGLMEARWLVGNISTLYVPELVVGITPACCSDHQSFTAQGFASTWVFERNGPIADPMYHNSGDLSDREGYDWDQIYAASQVILASVLEIAGFSFV